MDDETLLLLGLIAVGAIAIIMLQPLRAEGPTIKNISNAITNLGLLPSGS